MPSFVVVCIILCDLNFPSMLFYSETLKEGKLRTFNPSRSFRLNLAKFNMEIM